jgi:hypothetical protein
MKKSFLLYIFTLALFVPLTTQAGTAKKASPKIADYEAYTGCQRKALAHKEATVAPALQKYVRESAAITTRAKTSFEKISWYIDTSYRENSKKIISEKKLAEDRAGKKVDEVRKGATTTFQVESALCDTLYKKKTDASKSATKQTRSNIN